MRRHEEVEVVLPQVPVMTFEQIEKRLGQHDVLRMREGFLRLHSGHSRTRGRASGSPTVSLAGFLGGIIEECWPACPKSFARRLFQAFDRTQSGDLGLEEFLSGVVVLRCGTPEERLRFVFDVCDVDRNGRVTKQELMAYLKLLDLDPAVSHAAVSDEALAALFETGGDETGAEEGKEGEPTVADEVDIDKFLTWGGSQGMADGPLISWIFELDSAFDNNNAPGPVSVSSSSPNVVASSTAKELGLDTFHVEALGELYQSLVDLSYSGALDEDAFVVAMQADAGAAGGDVTEAFLRRLFAALDADESGFLDSREFIAGIAMAFGGEIHEKMEFLWRLYVDEDGALTQGALYGLLAAATSSPATSEATAAVALAVAAEAKGAKSTSRPSLRDTELTADELSTLVTSAFESVGAGTAPGSTMNAAQFRVWATAHPDALRVFLHLQRTMYVRLGRRPTYSSQEADMLGGMLRGRRFDAAAPGKPGDVWCVIDRNWLESWCEYAGLGLPGFEPAPRAPGAIQRMASQGPAAIDNSALLDASERLLKTAFMGEDFELVPLEVWQLFVSWYGGSPACKREIVQTMRTFSLGDGSGRVEEVVDGFELELYPPVLTFTATTQAGQPSRRPPVPRVVSRVATIAEAKDLAVEALRLQDPAGVLTRLWVKPNSSLLSEAELAAAAEEKAVAEALQVAEGRVFATWPRSCPTATATTFITTTTTTTTTTTPTPTPTHPHPHPHPHPPPRTTATATTTTTARHLQLYAGCAGPEELVGTRVRFPFLVKRGQGKVTKYYPGEVVEFKRYGEEGCPVPGHNKHDGSDKVKAGCGGSNIGMHQVLFDDGDKKWYDLRGKKYVRDDEFSEAPLILYGEPPEDEARQEEDTWVLCADEHMSVGDLTTGVGAESLSAAVDDLDRYSFLVETRYSAYSRWPRASKEAKQAEPPAASAGAGTTKGGRGGGAAGSNGRAALGESGSASLNVRDAVAGTIGLRNLGNTCYMNSTIQGRLREPPSPPPPAPLCPLI